jgi:pantoate--beta-alanine ligase
MEIANSYIQINEILASEKSLAFVPTMGALHFGHIALVEIAKKHAQKTIVSIFVNPTQFAPSEDLSKYPRTLDKDLEKLKAAGVDFVYVPSISDIYPDGEKLLDYSPPLENILEGEFRPTHFRGVCTVVKILFDQIKPIKAVFGEKDYQQLLVIKQMVRDLSLDIDIIPAPIIREGDGLAMSSRNVYLSPEQRIIAPELFKVLSTMKIHLKNGDGSIKNLEKWAVSELTRLGFKPDYISVRCAENLSEIQDLNKPARILAVARLGDVRLLDNLAI